MPTERSRPDSDTLELEPRLKVKRLNRLAVLLAGMLGIIVLWVAYFVLSSRSPAHSQPAQPPNPGAAREQAAIDRLLRQASRPDPPPMSTLGAVPDRPQQEPPPTQQPAATLQSSRPIAYRRPPRPEPAYAADVIVAAFQQASFPPRPGLSAEALAQIAGAAPQPRGLAATSDSTLISAPPAAASMGPHRAFLQQARDRQPAAARSPAVQPPPSPYLLSAGTLIPAILTTGIHSDLPGQTTALVRRDVYDSPSGRHLLIPQGARLVGEYDHRVAWGQKRVLLAWQRLIFPDGSSLDLEALPGVDTAAMAGLRDRVNHHFLRTFGGALLLSAVSAGAQLSQPQESADGGAPSARQLVAAAVGQELGRVTAEITRRNVDRQPTLQIRPGYLFHVELTGDLVLPRSHSLDVFGP